MRVIKNGRYYLNLFIAAIVFLAFAFFTLTLYVSSLWAQSFLHPARRIPTGETLKANNVPFQEIILTASDGVKLAAWYTPPQNGVAILMAHGYSDARPESLYAIFVRHGYGALAWDFRAHGASGGEMSTLGYYEQLDVEAALDYALAQEGVEHIGAWGGSMGAATVILTAAKRTEIEAVVSDSAYPSLEDVMKINIPFEFMRPWVIALGEWKSGADMDDVRPVDEIGRIGPRAIFIIDGWDGGAILMNSPHRLYEAANEPKQIWVEEGIPHLSMFAYFPEEYARKTLKFFDRYLLGK